MQAAASGSVSWCRCRGSEEVQLLDWQRLLSLSSPWVQLVSGEERDIDNFVLGKVPEDRSVIRVIRGSRCTTRDHLFQEWAAAFQFPYYFGHNWDAMVDCLRDLEWLPGDSYVVFITNADHLLVQDDRDFNALVSILRDVAGEWATPMESFSPKPRGAIPFRVVLHCKPEKEADVERRLERVGVESSAL